MTNLVDLQATLPTLKNIDFIRNDEGDFDLVEVEVKPHSFIRDGMLYISMERGDNAGSYDGQYINEWETDGIAYINPRLEAWAKEHGTYWEWQDGGTIVLAN